ncbi:GntR family transcriptional regulator [Streptomyces sp. LP11]|uniref:GntR family transcriptional regulator n=1 Tax=Streptomyces pyxinicus TaxID=2970331 RepID=A0ABT2AWC7_9ACTN|nr:GntR family transcriptional regulator [Streptomyces sp. LP11]MCS0600568.1 GntR family transcriptional regulator [Streptomyces sp. LP11]
MSVDPEHVLASGPTRPPGPRPSHRRIADALRDRIRSGELWPGQRLPTQARLADEFGVERGAVREALRVLRSERLLTGVSRGSPAVVAAVPGPVRPPPGPPAPPQPTMAGLAPRIASAFAVEHVRIDALCLTSVSLTLAVGEPLRRIHAGELKPAKIDVRVLLPSRDIELAFPAPVDPAGDDTVHRRWLAVRNAQGLVLRQNLLALRTTHGIEVRLLFRALPFTPPLKLYLLNGAEALFAYYTPERREREIGHERVALYDADGTRSMLFAFERRTGPRDAAFVEQSRLWFDALWGTISSELVLAS